MVCWGSGPTSLAIVIPTMVSCRYHQIIFNFRSSQVISTFHFLRPELPFFHLCPPDWQKSPPAGRPAKNTPAGNCLISILLFFIAIRRMRWGSSNNPGCQQDVPPLDSLQKIVQSKPGFPFAFTLSGILSIVFNPLTCGAVPVWHFKLWTRPPKIPSAVERSKNDGRVFYPPGESK